MELAALMVHLDCSSILFASIVDGVSFLLIGLIWSSHELRD